MKQTNTDTYLSVLALRQSETSMFEAIKQVEGRNKQAKENQEKNLLEQVSEEQALFEAVSRAASTSTRADAMATVLEWSESGDPTWASFEEYAQGMAGISEDGDATDDDEEDYNEYLFAMAQSLLALGVKQSVVESLIDESDKSASAAFIAVADAIEASDLDDDEIIANFSVEEEVMNEAKKKVVRNGVTKWVKKPLRKKRLSSAQRAGLKKARKKSHSSAAKAKRKKSMRKRKSANM